MATRVDPERAEERGLSLLEAIIVVTLTAMMALLLLPLLPRASVRNAAMTERAADQAMMGLAEREFRALVSAALLQQEAAETRLMLSGEGAELVLTAALDRNIACARAGTVEVRLITASDGLVCESEGRRRILLPAQEGQARFSYSRDGAVWTATGGGAAQTAFVRFDSAPEGRQPIVWIERVGGAP